MNITAHRPAVIFQGAELTDVDAVIPRIGASHTFYGTAVVRQFEMRGVFTANESHDQRGRRLRPGHRPAHWQ
jgi:ribosomal protein S6--L-glutamate ligase